jgi:hypothetical protein
MNKDSKEYHCQYSPDDYAYASSGEGSDIFITVVSKRAGFDVVLAREQARQFAREILKMTDEQPE